MVAYPLDTPGTTWANIFTHLPKAPYPYDGSIFEPLVSREFHDWSQHLAVPVTFALAYYTVAHTANHLSRGHDYSKGNALSAKLLRAFVVVHNAGLCLYSFFTFLATAPVAIDLIIQGYRAAGQQGMQLALCSIPTNTPLLGRWAYFFYLSKYYEVMDSVILYLKGKKIGNLQSYHHAGALFSMYIAYRFQAQPVWVFCAYNSGVHTLMYAYYFTASLKLPFPKTLKRNLTTLQIMQIFWGTLLVNLYYIFDLQPAKVLAALTAKNIHSMLPAALWGTSSAGAMTGAGSIAASSSFFSAVSKAVVKGSSAVSAATSSSGAQGSLLDLSTYAAARASYGPIQSSHCMESTGVAAAVLGNTLYMGPLLVLFARFYIRSYFAKSTPSQAQPTRKGAAAPLAKTNGNGVHANGNGKKRQ